MHALEAGDAMSTDRPSGSLFSWTQIIYALHAFSLVTGVITTASVAGAFLTGWPSIIAVILNYIKRSEARGTWLDSHFRWQIRTFWLSLLFGALMFVMFLVFGLGIAGAASLGSDAGAAAGGISIMLLAIVGGLGMLAWYVYRVVKGWIRLSENQPI
jgi:uncharacterized membrane protein